MQSDVEQLAERVLSELPDWIWDGKSLPVPVEHIADTWFGLHVRDVEDLRSAPGVPPLPPDAGLSGLLLPAAGEIWVNAAEAREWPPRRRFTIGHELGHWCLHREGGRGLVPRASGGPGCGAACRQAAPRLPARGERGECLRGGAADAGGARAAPL